MYGPLLRSVKGDGPLPHACFTTTTVCGSLRSKEGGEAVKVVVRVRPLSRKEKQDGHAA